MLEPVNWTLSQAAHILTCVAESTDAGAVRLRVYIDGLAVRVRLCQHASEAAEWSQLLRRQWEQCGWTPANPATLGGAPLTSGF
jgi:hypothetical protein